MAAIGMSTVYSSPHGDDFPSREEHTSMALDNDNTWLYLGDSLVVQSSRSGETPGNVTSGTLFFFSYDRVDDVEVRIF